MLNFTMNNRNPFEEQHILQMALKKCKLLERSLLLMMVQVNLLKNKSSPYPYKTSDTNLLMRTSRVGGPVTQKRSSNGDLVSFEKQHKIVRFSVYISRSLQMINRNHSEMNVNIIKIKRNVEESLTKVEHIIKKHCKRNTILHDVESHCDDGVRIIHCHACILLQK